MHRLAAVLIVGLLLAGCSQAAAAPPADALTTLTVTDSSGVARSGEPVTTGLPFAQGKLAKGAALGLLDASGQAVPLQTRELAYWTDGSVKWVLLDFVLPADLPANGSATFALVARATDAKVASPVKTSESKGGLVVETGPLKVSISRDKFNLFGTVQADGKERLNGAAGLSITDTAGKVRTSRDDLADGYKVEVTEAGPIRTVVRATGEMQANEKYKLGFTCWYHFYAGSRKVRVFVTMRNLDGKSITATDQRSWQDAARARDLSGMPGNVVVKDVSLELPLAAGGKARIGGDGQVHELAAGKLYQDSSASWMWQGGDGNIVDPRLKENAEWMKKNAPAEVKSKAFWEFDEGQYKALTDRKNYVGCSFRGYKVFDAAGKELVQADRAPGWVQVGDTTVALRWFWQMYPKTIEVSADGKLRLGLLPGEWSERSYNHVFVGHVHKTHELLLDFGGGDAKSAEAQLDDRLLAVAPNDYYCASGAFNTFLMPENRKDFARYEDWALTAVKVGVNPNVNVSRDSSIEIEREKIDFFGIWHFGDTSKRGWRGFGQYLELDIPYCLVAHWARTNNRSFFNEAEIAVRELMDVPAHGGGYGHQKGESSHYYTSGSLFYYYLSGLDFVRDSIKVSHDDFAKPAPWHMRSFAITMWSNLDMLREFGGEQYLENVKKDLAWLAGPDRKPSQDPQTGFRPYGQVNFQEFMLGMGMDSLGQYCTMFPDDQEARDRLVALSHATIYTHREKKWLQNNSCCNAHTWAWLFTGNDKHLDFASELLDESLKPNDKEWPIYRTGTGSGKYWSEFGHRDTQTHMWARWWRKNHGTPKPPAKLADLAAAVEGDTVTLTWTAPAGPTPATRYLVKLSDRPLADEVVTAEQAKTAANWWMAPLAGELKVEPAAVGAKMSVKVKLPAGAKYAGVRGQAQVGPVLSLGELSNVELGK